MLSNAMRQKSHSKYILYSALLQQKSTTYSLLMGKKHTFDLHLKIKEKYLSTHK